MALYFFNLHDGEKFTDTVGSEHADLASVREEAVEFIVGRLQGNPLKTANVAAWILNVTDQAGLTVLILSMSVAVRGIDPACDDRDLLASG